VPEPALDPPARTIYAGNDTECGLVIEKSKFVPVVNTVFFTVVTAGMTRYAGLLIGHVTVSIVSVPVPNKI
jgi:hypothetical protein